MNTMRRSNAGGGDDLCSGCLMRVSVPALFFPYFKVVSMMRTSQLQLEARPRHMQLYLRPGAPSVSPGTLTISVVCQELAGSHSAMIMSPAALLTMSICTIAKRYASFIAIKAMILEALPYLVKLAS